MGMEMILRGQVKDEKSEHEGTKSTKAYKFHTFTLIQCILHRFQAVGIQSHHNKVFALELVF